MLGKAAPLSSLVSTWHAECMLLLPANDWTPSLLALTQLELYGSAQDEQTGRTIPLRPPTPSSLGATPPKPSPSSDS